MFEREDPFEVQKESQRTNEERRMTGEICKPSSLGDWKHTASTFNKNGAV